VTTAPDPSGQPRNLLAEAAEAKAQARVELIEALSRSGEPDRGGDALDVLAEAVADKVVAKLTERT
jgi:hypothetical protein